MTNESVSTLTVHIGGILYFNKLKFDFIRILLMRYKVNERGKEGISNWTEEKIIKDFFGNS